MNKKVVILATAMVSVAAQAQLITKQGVDILPKTGDWGIGVSSTPIVDLFGNLIKINSGTTFSDPSSFDMVDGVTLFGKKFIADNQAMRYKVGLLNSKNTTERLLTKDGQSDPNVTVTDKRSISQSYISLGVGKEYRKGRTRLQGFYGFEGSISFGGSGTTYTYGNDYSSSNTAPTIYNWGTNISGSSRVTSNKNGKSFGIGANCFAGVEYFIMPMMSIGGELSAGLGLNKGLRGIKVSENWDAGASQVKKTETKTGGQSSLGLLNNGGSLYFMFYF